MLEILDRPSDPGRLAAFQRLVTHPGIGAEDLVRRLREAFRDPDFGIVTLAIETLGARNDSRSLRALEEEFREGDADLRRRILRASASNSWAEALIRLGAGDPDEGVRLAAAEAVPAKDPSPEPAATSSEM